MAEVQGQSTGKAPENQGADGAGAAAAGEAPSFDETFKQLSDALGGTAAAEPADGKQPGEGTEGAGDGGAGAGGDAGAAGDGTQGGLPDPATIGADGKPKGGEQQGKAPEGDQQGKAPDGDGKGGEQQGTGRLSDTDFLEQFRQIVQGGQQKGQGGEKEPEAQPQGPSPYTAEEQTLLDAVQKDFPDIVKGQELIRSREYQALTAHVFGQVIAYCKPLFDRLGTVEGTATKMADDAHTAALHTAVSDYNEVAPKVVAWVKTQPDFLKPAYEAVIAKGSVKDVVSLIDIWREKSGTAAPAGGQQQGQAGGQQRQGGGAPPAGGQQRKPPDAKVVAGLVPVATKRSTGTGDGGVDPSDFDGAFKVATEEAARRAAVPAR